MRHSIFHTTLDAVRRVGRTATVVVAVAMSLTGLWAIAPTAARAASQTVTYSATVTVPVPPASNFAGSGGGDGWAVAMTPTAVYNVFHHQGTLQVACHLQTDASSCWPAGAKTITDASGDNYASAGQPGLWLDQANGHLFVFATRTSDGTAGVVCIDTTQPVTNLNPFCGFTALSAVGGAYNASYSAISDPVIAGTNWYAFNFVTGAGVTGTENKLMCFSLTTLSACAGQPYAVNIGSAAVATSLPSPSIAVIGSQVIVPVNTAAGDEIACMNAATHGACAGAWPLPIATGYVSGDGAPFPMLSSTGAVIGLCLPTATDPCYSLTGAVVATPPGLTTAMAPASTRWNGPALVIGPRIYVPNGNGDSELGQVDCYDFNAHAGCANFPKSFTNLSYLYTVNPDPQRPSCIWVNADGGTSQIQNFDAFTGGPCGKGAIRVLSSSFVVPINACIPASFTSLQLLQPPRPSYTSGTVGFEDASGNPIAGVPTLPVDSSGAVNLTNLHLVTTNGLPQFLITLDGVTGTPGSVEVKVTWTGAYDPSCVNPGTTVTGLSSYTNGLAFLAGDGGMFAVGDRPFVSAANFGGQPGALTTPLGQVIPTTFSALSATPDRHGFFDVLRTGQLFTVGTAVSRGDLTGHALNAPIVGIAATPTGDGYWMVGSDGGIFNFGDAGWYGSLGGIHLNKPIVGIAATPDGRGFWLVASDGGIFNFGDAGYYGSLGSVRLNAPIVGMTPTVTGHGYWLVGSDGGVFQMGDAGFYGSLGGVHLNQPIVAIAATTTGHGYWLVAGDGGVFQKGDAPFQGSLPAAGIDHLRSPIVGAIN